MEVPEPSGTLPNLTLLKVLTICLMSSRAHASPEEKTSAPARISRGWLSSIGFVSRMDEGCFQSRINWFEREDEAEFARGLFGQISRLTGPVCGAAGFHRGRNISLQARLGCPKAGEPAVR
jgi:hypothetical protein